MGTQRKLKEHYYGPNSTAGRDAPDLKGRTFRFHHFRLGYFLNSTESLSQRGWPFHTHDCLLSEQGIQLSPFITAPETHGGITSVSRIRSTSGVTEELQIKFLCRRPSLSSLVCLWIYFLGFLAPLSRL